MSAEVQIEPSLGGSVKLNEAEDAVQNVEGQIFCYAMPYTLPSRSGWGTARTMSVALIVSKLQVALIRASSCQGSR